MTWPFIQNQLYSRRAFIHAKFGGQQQGGISTPRDTPAIFIFTGHRAKIVGYGDKWMPDGSLRYTGKGQTGEMKMDSGNRAIRDHVQNGRDILIFEQTKKGAAVRYIGQFFCAGWETERQKDKNGEWRNAIVFLLVPAHCISESEAQDDDAESEGLIAANDNTLLDLRRRAFAAAAPSTKTGQATRSVYRRSAEVKNYVLARANGTCECCGSEAPFINAAGKPYLEPHHIRRVATVVPTTLDIWLAFAQTVIGKPTMGSALMS
ncbi:hypothetical protein [Novosphingobium sp. ST904]|uniref:HNH endonuclease n=1 Tax=Novosphingobium sp. ST904 TaxID=1684385 RepID=UPI0006C84142|nr:hypothetical protein [Novosphingobium sp. ST904]TCM33754.1 5-methylcytosine-specific restriction protein A [Novosphingobium sp. ST904]